MQGILGCISRHLSNIRPASSEAAGPPSEKHCSTVRSSKTEINSQLGSVQLKLQLRSFRYITIRPLRQTLKYTSRRHEVEAIRCIFDEKNRASSTNDY